MVNLLTVEKNKSLHINKDDTPIYHHVFSCENVYNAENAFSYLYTHEYIEVSMITSGNGVHCIFDQTIPCQAGDIYITPPKVPHGYFLADKGENMTVRQIRFNIYDWFDGDISTPESPRFCYGIFNDNAVTAYAMLNVYMRQRINALYDDIEREITERKNEWKDAVGGYLAQLLIDVGRYINCSIKNVSSASPKEWNIVLSTIRYVKENYDDCMLTLESIAQTMYISKSHLSRIFKNLTGKLFSEYLRDVRFNAACKLLKESNMKVEDIVAACGLCDVASFYKNFSQRNNMTPYEYRKSEKDAVNNIEKEENNMTILNDISANLQSGRARAVTELVKQALDSGIQPEIILNNGLLVGMNIIGEKFKNGEVFVPEVLVSARAMNMGTEILKPYLAEHGAVSAGKVCIGTIQGDLHDIGKNIVKMMMESKGLEVIDLGVDVAPEKFVETAIEQGCKVIACSSLLTTTMPTMQAVVKAAEDKGVREQIKIMIGGAPVSEDFCKQIGADVYTADAASAADMAEKLCKE